MKCVKVAAASINQIPLDWNGNTQRILAVIDAARAQNITILCLPELSITGYGCEDLFLSPHTIERAWKVLHEKIAPATSKMIVSVGLPVSYQNSHYNAAALVVDGVVVGFTVKQFLAGDGIHYEPRWFKAWPAGVATTFERGGKSYPIGDIHYRVGGIRIGFEICEDAWVAQRPGANLAFQGVDIILNPSASHFARKKYAVRKRFVEEGSRAFGVTYVYSNLVGNEAGKTIFDGGCLIAYDGSVIAAEKRFSYHSFNVIAATIDVDYSRANRNQVSSYRPVVDSIQTDCISVPFDYPKEKPRRPRALELQGWESSASLIYEEFTRAVALGLYDYLRKSWSYGFSLSLSGGADSGCIASLIRCMVALCCADLTIDGMVDALGYIPALKSLKDKENLTEEEIVHAILTCVYQATDNSSDTTRNAAKEVATAIGAAFYELNIQAAVDEYRHLIEEAMGRTLSWEKDDITLQNIQARSRAPSIWMFANVENRILLATSNRSEASVGYATMDGDTAGGLSPIAGVDKPFIRRYLQWLETSGLTLHNDAETFKISALSYINAQQPTAELRPQDENQTDEADLMPYDVLNTIEDLLVRCKQSPKEIFESLRVEYPKEEDAILLGWLERFFKLFTRNQWKRERYAPSFHLDAYSLDPRSWYRFPILNAGFHVELAELRALVKAQSVEK